MNQLDQILTNFAVWENGTNWIGTADVELPSFEALTETIKGSGIAGEVNAPVAGHFGSQTLKLKFRTITSDSIRLFESKVQSMDFRGNQQIFDTNKGYVNQPVVIKTRFVPVNFSLGKLAPAAATETANEFEVHYIKILLDGKELLEFDKFNFIFKVNGKDVLADVRKNLGL